MVFCLVRKIGGSFEEINIKGKADWVVLDSWSRTVDYGRCY